MLTPAIGQNPQPVSRPAPHPGRQFGNRPASIPGVTPEALMHSDFLILGDSHIAYFRQAMQMIGLLPWQYQFCEAGVGTGIGTGTGAATNAFETFRRFLRDKNRQSTLILQLGEAVCSFVIWYRAKLYNETIADQLRASISAYVAFIHELRGQGFLDIVVTGATLPTIRDGDQLGAVAQMRREVTATLVERTKLTMDYNKALQTHAKELGLRYLDISADLLDPDTKTIKAGLRSQDPCDHHLDYQAAGTLWAGKLRDLIIAQTSRRRFLA
ncbi:MAG TPA: hypothetical protein VM659_00730 [Dongiaceae bacterium]|nr:hypothetical protein [Dongiaceae bacterium]